MSDMKKEMKKCPIFKGVGKAFLNDLVSQAVSISVKQNEVLIKEGEKAHGMYFVICGSLQVFSKNLNNGPNRANSKTYELAVLKPGDFFGELGMFVGQKRIASIKALIPSELLYIPHEKFQKQMMMKDPDALLIGCNLGVALANKLTKANEQLIQFSKEWEKISEDHEERERLGSMFEIFKRSLY